MIPFIVHCCISGGCDGVPEELNTPITQNATCEQQRSDLPWPVTAAPTAERPTVGHDADRLTMDTSLRALSLPAQVAARHDALPQMSAASTA
jgi:hypothetical protein